MRYLKLLGVFCLLGALAGCNTTPPASPYQAATGNFEPYGYRDKTLANGDFEIRFIANKHTPRDIVESSARRRAAELTLKAGFDRFAVIDRVYERHVETRIERETFFGSGRDSRVRTSRPDTTRRFSTERRIVVLIIRPYRGDAPDGAIRTFEAAALANL